MSKKNMIDSIRDALDENEDNDDCNEILLADLIKEIINNEIYIKNENSKK